MSEREDMRECGYIGGVWCVCVCESVFVIVSACVCARV